MPYSNFTVAKAKKGFGDYPLFGSYHFKTHSCKSDILATAYLNMSKGIKYKEIMASF